MKNIFSVKTLASLLNIKTYTKTYYGYIVVAASFLIITLAYGAQSSFGVFFKPISDNFGWSRAETSGPFAVYLVVSGTLSIFSGRLSDRFGCRRLVSIGGIILGIGYILMSRIVNLWQLYLFYSFLVAIGISTIYVPIVTLVVRWFVKRRGLFSGISTTGVAFGTVIMPPIASRIMESFQWRIPLVVIGGVLILAIALLGQLLRNAPEAVDPSGNMEDSTSEISESEKGISLREAFKMRQFWMVAVAWILYGFLYQIAIVHIIPYATDLGMSALAAATILTTIGLTGTIGRLTLGHIADKLGNVNTTFTSFVLIGLCYIGLSFSHGIWALYVFAAIFGYVVAFGLLMVPILAEYFGLKYLGIISGVVICFNSLGGAIGPPVAGGIFDATASYHQAFIACAAAGLAAALTFWLLRLSHKPTY